MLNVLITGASSGLGEALALEHAAAGDSLLLLARRRDRLSALAKRCRALGPGRVEFLAGDVSGRSVLDAAAGLARRRLGGLDLAYANAGYSQSGKVEELSLARWRRQMAVNLEGVLHTVQACLPLLKASRGRLCLVGSVVGYGSLSGSAAYAASKAGVRALAQVLDLELASEGVSVTHVAPGFFGCAADELSPDKKAIVAEALATLGWDRAATVMVGDRAQDRDAARANGIRFIAAAWGFGSAEEHLGADHLASTPAELAGLLAGLRGRPASGAERPC